MRRTIAIFVLSLTLVSYLSGQNIQEISQEEFKTLISNPNKAKWKFVGDKPVVVEFFATWCAPCRLFEPHLEAFADQNRDEFRVYKVDVDKEPALARRYGITKVPSFLFIPVEGKPKKRLGGITYQELLQQADSVR